MTDSSNGSDPRGGDAAGAEDAASITVQAVRPHRDRLEIRFPRVIGYLLEVPEEWSTASKGGRHLKAVLDPYNPEGSTAHVRFETTKTHRYETDPRRCPVNWIVLDSGWEEEFCRVVEAHPQVLSYVKNHNLGLEVPYLRGSEKRTYLPDFIVLIDDGQGPDDPLRLVVEISGFRREDANGKKATMESHWVPGVNRLACYGRWERSSPRAARCGSGPRGSGRPAGGPDAPEPAARSPASDAAPGSSPPGPPSPPGAPAPSGAPRSGGP